ncbi:TPA: hypothetical protein U1341_002213, partial [Streptococcus suis]|nr:hypothetical protein [Streptococcus suis]
MSKETQRNLSKLSKKYGLNMIGGSDFHGIYKQNRIGSGNVSFAYILKTFYEVKAVVTGEGISSIDDLDIYEK